MESRSDHAKQASLIPGTRAFLVALGLAIAMALCLLALLSNAALLAMAASA